nr:MAG TPA: hypothetical protein [Caudoviricetes sp.]
MKKNTIDLISYIRDEFFIYRVEFKSLKCELTNFYFEIIDKPINNPDKVMVVLYFLKTDSEGYCLSNHEDCEYIDRNDFYNMNEDELYNFLKSKVKIELFQ